MPNTRYSFSLLIFVLMIKPSFAYVDPGSGSYIIQLILAGLLGMIFYIKQIKNFLRNLFTKFIWKNKSQKND